MKKFIAVTFIFCSLLTACSSNSHSKKSESRYYRTNSEINAERNSAEARVTSASIEQNRMQRQDQFEDGILRYKLERLEKQNQENNSSW